MSAIVTQEFLYDTCLAHARPAVDNERRHAVAGWNLRRRTILEAILMKAAQYRLAFGFSQSPRREPRPGRRPGKKAAAALPVPTGARHCQGPAGWLHAHQWTELLYRSHHDFSVSVIAGPNSVATFF